MCSKNCCCSLWWSFSVASSFKVHRGPNINEYLLKLWSASIPCRVVCDAAHFLEFWGDHIFAVRSTWTNCSLILKASHYHCYCASRWMTAASHVHSSKWHCLHLSIRNTSAVLSLRHDWLTRNSSTKISQIWMCCHSFNKVLVTIVMSRPCKELASSRQCIDGAFLRSVVSPECLPVFSRAPSVISQHAALCAPGWMRAPLNGRSL